ncbi:OmpA family protein [Clostridium bovifaecis]|uniref:OmpA family protein n=1 Tax=Clostridium bovifaecis TaxID=2184719 RepID=A0A6I6EN49_9CLOT|nr:OmpA family protein [Clostridium bovifaecis]
MSKRKKPEGSEVNTEAWLATYADTITLVLTFFVLLYSYSNIDAVKFKQLSTSLQSVLTGQNSTSVLEFNYNGEVPIVGPPQDLGPQQGGESQGMYSKVKSFVDTNNLKDVVEIKKDTKGIIIELKDNVLFDTAKAEIKEPSRGILDKISKLIGSFPNEIIVEGHTDNVPIHNYEFASNWELSTQRAVNVLKYFVENKGLNPKRFQAAGYGEYRPIAPNDTYANKTKNRRVNILIVAGEKESK